MPSLQQDLRELQEAGIIDAGTAERIRDHYRQKAPPPGSGNNRLLTAFAILGSILVGLGIILIIAHNWDQLGRSVKTLIAFLPLLIGQAACAFTLLKKPESQAWREGSAVFTCFAVGAVISMVSQIYNIPGSVESFMLSWSLLCLPLVYVLRSGALSMLYIVGITSYGCMEGYKYNAGKTHWYWLCLLGVLPFYYYLIRQEARGNATAFHHWLIPGSVAIVLGSLSYHAEDWLFVMYGSLFGLFYLIGNSDYFRERRLINNGYLLIGALGSMAILLMLSFDDFWVHQLNVNESLATLFQSREFIFALLLTALATITLWMQRGSQLFRNWQPLDFAFLLIFVTFLIGYAQPLVATILVNLAILIAGLLTIRKGARLDNLLILNYGLMIITALITCRFFDVGLSYVLRGLLFVIVGLGFFFANYWMIKKRKQDEAA